MAFGSIEITTITRTQDYTTIKHNEDHKPMMDQMNIGQTVQQEEVKRSQEVVKSDEAEWYNKQFDARDKGDNEYNGDGGKKRKKKETREQVIVNGHQGFDIKI
ncbi:MAG: hypothetical protein IJ801_05165 [Lachnospiraceae bacterium]|nr:hypothetical protein [Lachnospiraceae bacterium]